RCCCRGCERPATAVAISDATASYPVAYCERHGRLVERFGRPVTYFPVCVADGCDELASRLALVHSGPHVRNGSSCVICTRVDLVSVTAAFSGRSRASQPHNTRAHTKRA